MDRDINEGAVAGKAPGGSAITRCLSCYAAFPSSDVLETLSVGARVAFDPERGRLWIICTQCARSTLLPFEARWEALEELERVCRTSARLLKQGDNVALFQVRNLEIVRVGRAGLHEESWWRYGHAFLTRAERARVVAKRGKFVHAAMWTVMFGFPFWGLYDPAAAIDRARTRRLGRDVWRGSSRCMRCGDVQAAVQFAEVKDLIIEGDAVNAGVLYTCHACGTAADSGHHWRGVAAEHVLRRALAFENFAGGDEGSIAAATGLIERNGSPGQLMQRLARERRSLASLPGDALIATEIALNAGIEAQLLSEEVALIDARWREEEIIAGIIDGELTP